MPNIKYAIFSILLTFQALSGLSQIPQIDTLEVLQAVPAALDSLERLDSLLQNNETALAIYDSLKNSADTLVQVAPQDSSFASKGKTDGGDVETTIDYQAEDSIFFDLSDRKMYMYGESSVDYGNMSLAAERINVDWTQNSLEATHILEDSTNRKKGKPVFTEQGTSYETDDMRYNFKTRKAIINGIITEQQGAIMHGERVKKNENDEMFVRKAKYTTCNLEHPHFHINSAKLKVIPGNKLLSGPFNLQFGDIPTPIGFPFGLFPEPQEKSSGIIFPSYGEDNTRGFFLRELGYYFYMGEYIDLRLTTDIFSRGNYSLHGNTRYKVRYKFNGTLSADYNKTFSTQFEDNSFSEDLWVRWSHQPESFGTSRFSASVSAGTSSYTANRNTIAQDFNQNINSQFSSNISYSKNFRGTPFNMSVNARHSQNIGTGIVTMSLPEISFNASRILPFQGVPALEKTPFNKLGFTYRMSVKNELSNAAVNPISGLNVLNYDTLANSQVDFNGDNWSAITARARRGIRHSIPISTSFPLAKNFTVSPSFNYNEVWYGNELNFGDYDAELGGNVVDTLQGFSRAGWYSGGASISTRLYGFFPFGGKRVEAMRHVMTPNLGFSMSPDFAHPDRGYYQEVTINEEGDTRRFSRYQGYVYGGPPQGESATLSFSLNNNLEMKVLSRNDSLGEYKKIKIFDNLSMSTGYNLLADSFNLQNINWNARTSLFNRKVSVNLSGTFDPYVWVLDSIQERENQDDRVFQRQIDQYTWNNGQGIGQLSRMSMALGFNLSPKGAGGNREREEDPSQLPNAPGDVDDPFGVIDENLEAGNVNKFISDDPRQYVPFDVPWRLSINYNLSLTRRGFEEPRLTQALTFSGDVSLTQNTEINFNSGYDLERKDFSFTRIAVKRDLHCWNISFNWVPFGPRQSYFVSIQVSAATLKDLKLDKRAQPVPQLF